MGKCSIASLKLLYRNLFRIIDTAYLLVINYISTLIRAINFWIHIHIWI